ncbi:Hypothetical predicted protein [Mytilus galloprovincialis]|uniref:Uncharacterized protein n=1 Tax=Mytilus galloprovincialis TaxID=29158 RepID=A0A8B6DYE1_MYTGA|nr:Hypothetical predicted protein [Mytilus galloprovincialis]
MGEQIRLVGVIIGTGLGCLLMVILLGVVIQTFCETNCCRLDLHEATDDSIEDTSQHQREAVDKPYLTRIRLWIHKHLNQVRYNTRLGSKIVFVLICYELVGQFVSGEGNDSSSSSDGTILGAVLGSICVMLVVVTCLIVSVCCKSKVCSVQPSQDTQRNTTNITVNLDRPPLGPPRYSSLFPNSRLPPLTNSISRSRDDNTCEQNATNSSLHGHSIRPSCIPAISPPEYTPNIIPTSELRD